MLVGAGVGVVCLCLPVVLIHHKTVPQALRDGQYVMGLACQVGVMGAALGAAGGVAAFELSRRAWLSAGRICLIGGLLMGTIAEGIVRWAVACLHDGRLPWADRWWYYRVQMPMGVVPLAAAILMAGMGLCLLLVGALSKPRITSPAP